MREGVTMYTIEMIYDPYGVELVRIAQLNFIPVEGMAFLFADPEGMGTSHEVSYVMYDMLKGDFSVTFEPRPGRNHEDEFRRYGFVERDQVVTNA